MKKTAGLADTKPANAADNHGANSRPQNEDGGKPAAADNENTNKE